MDFTHPIAPNSRSRPSTNTKEYIFERLPCVRVAHCSYEPCIRQQLREAYLGYLKAQRGRFQAVGQRWIGVHAICSNVAGLNVNRQSLARPRETHLG